MLKYIDLYHRVEIENIDDVTLRNSFTTKITHNLRKIINIYFNVFNDQRNLLYNYTELEGKDDNEKLIQRFRYFLYYKNLYA